ncbi:hypothetical protein [Saccharicrinis fermentans]|nr:hypothetical protein [Saccharicrinis fermentans]
MEEKSLIDNEVTNESSVISLESITGLWLNKECNISFQISGSINALTYVFTSEKRKLTGSVDIKEEGTNDVYIIFNGIEWSEYLGELGPEYFEDIPDSLVHEKPELILPTTISALYSSEESNFVIQNYGNSMNYYVKLSEGCDKYIYFSKQENLQADTLGVLTNLISKTIKDYSVFYWQNGDINNDKIDDYIVVMQSDISNSELTSLSDTYERKVVLLETIENFPNVKISAINSNLIDCSTCGGAGVGDPFQGITIKNNYFSFEQLYGACDKSFVVTTFKFDINSGKWYLHSIGSDNYSCRNVESGNVNVSHTSKRKKDFGLIEFENFERIDIF